MFLSPTPPRLTRRSRLDDWLLLLLRAAALLLLAIAFARPFLRQPAALDPADAERRRVVVLVDASASLRRAGLWDRAKAAATETIDGLGPGDRLAVLTFDTATRPLLGFAESASLEPSRRQAVARSRLAAAEPSWKATDLGRALIDAVAATKDVADATEKAARTPRRIVLVTDLQRGAKLDALGVFEWPPDVELELKTIDAAGSNATPQRVADAVEGTTVGDAPIRVRVANETGSDRERFRLRWDGADGKAAEPVEVYVPPGESRVASVPRPTGGGGTLRLEGDAEPFDDLVYVAEGPPREATVLFVGDDRTDDPAGLLYYLDRVYATAARRTIDVRRVDPSGSLAVESPATTPLAVLAAPTTSENAATLRSFAEAGGTVACVVRSPEQAANLAVLAGVPAVGVEEARGVGDAMLAEIAFDHPLFAPLAGAAVQRLHDDPLPEASRDRCSGVWRWSHPRAVRGRRSRGDRDAGREGPRRRVRRGLAPDRRLDRAVVEVRSARVHAARLRRPAGRRDRSRRRRSRAAAGRTRRPRREDSRRPVRDGRGRRRGVRRDRPPRRVYD